MWKSALGQYHHDRRPEIASGFTAGSGAVVQFKPGTMILISLAIVAFGYFVRGDIRRHLRNQMGDLRIGADTGVEWRARMSRWCEATCTTCSSRLVCLAPHSQKHRNLFWVSEVATLAMSEARR